jgi:hypothetical protein
METYLRIVTHPLLWIAVGFTVLVFVLQNLVSAPDDAKKGATGPNGIDWLKKHYVTVVLLGTVCLALLALTLYLVEIGMSVAELVDRLRRAAFDAETKPDDLRNYAYAVAALIGVLAASATIFFSVIKVWINERSARGAEEGLITDRINKAVEGLGAEKTVSRIGRPITIGKHGHASVRNVIEWSDVSIEMLDHEYVTKSGEWQVFTQTKPNLEVRIGSIYALERIAQDSNRDSPRVIDILTHYIRNNSGNDR